MKTWQKGLLAAALAACFLALASGFVQTLRDQLPPSRQQRQQEELSHVYRQPTAPAETVPETTEPTVPETTVPETTEATLPPETEPPRHYYDSVPRYDMTHYPDIRYDTGSIATAGSNITSMAMVASYLTGHPYLPSDLAGYFGDFIGNNLEWVEHANEQLQLPCTKAKNIDETITALREGKIALVVMNPNSIFGPNQHFVVFTGLTEDNKILLHDPNGTDYEKWDMKDKLENGFQRLELSGRYAGAWIYDLNEVGEHPFIYQSESTPQEMRYSGLTLTEEETELMAKLLCVEAGSEPFTGQQAVAEVILNRLWAENFPDTIYDIIHAEGQFEAAGHLYLGEPTHTQYEAIRRALNGPYILPMDVVFFSAGAVNDNVWGTIGAHTFCYLY